jgi:hypothetical protein
MSYKPDVGTVVSLNTGTVITGATPVSIEVKKPSGAVASWAGTIDADTMSVNHTIASGDLTESGEYILQAKVTLGANVWYGQSVVFIVKDIYKF